MAPSNLAKAMIFQTQTVDDKENKMVPMRELNLDATNTLGLVIFSIALDYLLELEWDKTRH